jgi:tripartite-type tricarboxylate transporter receptor subunit TctC
VPRLELKDTPIFSDMISGKITDKLGQQGYDYWLSMWKLDKWMALPPGTPDNVVKAYRDAFRQLAKDAAFIDEGKKMSEDFATQSPEDVEALVRTVGNTPPEATDYIAKLMRKQGIEIQ